MKAIILAAGIGSRLRPITDQKPKTLVEVNGKPMLGYLLENLKSNNVKEVIICTGFKADQIVNYCETTHPDVKFTFIENKDYDTTNNMYSLYLAREEFNDDCILMNADLVYDPEVISGLLQLETSAVAVDKGNYIEEAMKVIVNDKNNIINIAKTITPEDAYGCSIDVYRINQDDLHLLKEEMIDIIEKQKDVNQWTEVMLDNLFKTEKLIAKPLNIGEARWMEIDNYDDLQTGENIFNEHLGELKNKKIYFIDRDGTLTLGNDLIEGANDFLKALKEKGKEFFVLTNNSSKTPETHLKKFLDAGLDVSLEDILVSTQSATRYLKEKGYKKIYWVANTDTSGLLEKEGFEKDTKNPEAVLLTYDTEITYQKMVELSHLVKKGTPFFATHPDVVCPTPDGDIPDIGTFLKVIEMTTGKTPNRVFGKPNISSVESVLKDKGLTIQDAVVVGDRLYTDIKMAENNDLTSILVLSGETKRDHVEDSQYKPEIIAKSVKEIIEYL